MNESGDPDVFQYSNFRTFLRDIYDHRKEHQPAFSHRFFSQQAGLTSPNYLKLVMDGKRNLSKKSLVKFQSALGLKGKRADFFENLVFFNQAQSLSDRNLFYANILKIRGRNGMRKLEERQFQLYSDWRHIVIREMALLKGFRAEPGWIARKIGRGVTAKQAGESLALLSALGLLKRTANSLTPSDPDITTADEVRSLLVKNYHRQMMHMAVSAMDSLPPSRRDISSVTLSINSRDFPRVKEHIQLMRKELLNMGATPGEGEDVVQMNIQLFPLTGLAD